MSRILKIFGFTVTALLLLVSCGASLKNVTPYSPGKIAEAVITSQDRISVLHPLLPDDDYYAYYLGDIYGIKTDTIIDGAIYYADGMLADEIAVFLLSDHSGVKDIKELLVKYKEKRIDAFTGYDPEQTAILENSVVITHGDYAALLICENPQKAEDVFLACFSDNPPKIKDKTVLSSSENSSGAETSAAETSAAETSAAETSAAETSAAETSAAETSAAETSAAETEKVTEKPFVETDSPENDIFDSASLLEAWRGGDKSKLSGKSRRVFDACIEIIDTVINDDMSDYEKELAIHDWIINWTAYDKEANNNSPDAQPDPDNDNPYGAIIQKKAICFGYTAAFQLFMDLLDIECISVKGTSQNTGGEHAWNMVRINKEWYCVDVTWNDYFGEDKNTYKLHRYFNVTSRYMRDTKHQWDESKTPTADAGKLYTD